VISFSGKIRELKQGLFKEEMCETANKTNKPMMTYGQRKSNRRAKRS